ncbi:hypothetical protein GQ44DRAFT_606517 [Phaeosphaeriaceae sp. PMI808]|nr:hypothetical protein GQ44DRAFT_606517 [Phaeosphaeriaceae sp. PMI808]
MIHEVQANYLKGDLRGSKLPAVLIGDIAAAGIAASLVSPLIAAIDRAVVENAASSRHPLLPTLRLHILSLFRQPRLFFAAKPFLYVWALYASTYTTANSVESISKAVISKGDQILINSITFLSTCVVNVPLGIWKDIRFVQAYGQQTTPIVTPIVGATFLLRDATTIFGSINLPPMISKSISDSHFDDPAMKMATLQLAVPIFSQVVATPIHLLALDFYNNPQKEGSPSRAARMRRNVLPTTAMRCSRIIPAFGIGLIANTGLRKYFHGIIGVIEHY